MPHVPPSPPRFDFVQRDRENPALVVVDHSEFRGSLMLRPLSYRQRLEINKLRASYVSENSTIDDFHAAERYAWVALGFEKHEAFNPTELRADDLVEALFEETQRFFRAPST